MKRRGARPDFRPVWARVWDNLQRVQGAPEPDADTRWVVLSLIPVTVSS
jgi:hypothetical protein